MLVLEEFFCELFEDDIIGDIFDIFVLEDGEFGVEEKFAELSFA